MTTGPASGPERPVSIIIPVRNDPRLRACIASVIAAAEGHAIQLIVVDNNSAPEYAETLACLPAGTLLLREEREGAYAARNRALDAVTGEIVLFTDADCIVDPGWLREALAAADRFEADIVLGRNGQLGEGTPAQRLVQARYDSAFRRLPPGAASEIDTKNLAVRRHVFSALRFNDAYLRVGDTEFGLVAESLGFRVAYCPNMRVDHDNPHSITEFVAKQVCHGWGAQRIMRDHPRIAWHGGHLRLVSKVSHALTRIPFRGPLSLALARTVVAAARLVDRAGPGRLPFPLAYRLVYSLDKLGAAAGHVMYEAGQEEPRISTFLGRPLPRD